jgi:hypothetical protein
LRVLFERMRGQSRQCLWAILRVWRVLGVPAFVITLLASCSNSSVKAPLPDANKLLEDAADAMSQVTSGQFSLSVDGDLQAVRIQSAAGVAARHGRVGEASVNATRTDQVQVQYIVKDGQSYVKENEQEWRRLPFPAYDPSLFLDTNDGIPSTLGRATDGHTQASETVNRTACYKVRAIVPTDMVHQLSITTREKTMPARLWIAKDGNQLLKTQVSVQSTVANGPTKITLILSNLNMPVSIEAPPVP